MTGYTYSDIWEAYERPRKMTQAERIEQYMRDFGSITPIDAMVDLGVMRLAFRICDLRKAGLRIVKTIEKSKNRYGEVTHYARYSIAE